MRIAKRELAARLCATSGLLSLIEAMPKRDVMIVLTYHRIGNPWETPYDPGTFSATAEEFEDQIAYLKRHFHICTLDEALAMVMGQASFSTGVLVTFDDGYLDNYSLAFPILRSYSAQAVFFLPTAFVGTSRLPWWDAIAYTIKQTRNDVIRLEYPERAVLDLNRNGMADIISVALRLYKHPATTDRNRFLNELQIACESGFPVEDNQRIFMNWREAREMQQCGMVFGSHTDTHEILSRLSAEQQVVELRRSREILERELNCRIDALAYPVGAKDTFNDETIMALRENDYHAAFSYYGGFNLPGRTQPFDIPRFGVGRKRHARFRLQLSLGAVTARTWF
jgi:peptidoglycan/xylan/chitin deacetylase (PgdA/CDA1 family)